MREQKDARPRVDALTAPTSNSYDALLSGFEIRTVVSEVLLIN
jgi:hypothetical protein